MERLFSNRLRRRSVLLGTASFLTSLALASQKSGVIAHPKFTDYPFRLGLASGDPLPNSVVLWTRLAPNPLQAASMPPIYVPVQWQVATDEQMRQVIASGEAIATPELAHSVRVVVGGLEPGRWYWYRFQAGQELSPIGRTKTAPAANAPLEQLAFAFTSCQDWQAGYYPAYKHLTAEDLDFVVFLGDYIYEDGVQTDAPRQHNRSECVTLADYRHRYALYKSDPNLQAAHAAFPWIVTWDDHEVASNYANLHPEDESQQGFWQRRRNAYQAYYEHMPLRPRSRLNQASLQLYRRFSFGNLAQINVLDTRQYRTNQPCGYRLNSRCPEAYAQSATMLGSQQEQWLKQGLAQSSARWNIIAQQTMMAQLGLEIFSQERVFNLDQWDGYVAARSRFLDFLHQHQPSNPIIITGDLHSSWVNDLKANFDDPTSATIGTEFVSPSISSRFLEEFVPIVEAFLPENPQVKFFEGTAHGYVRCYLSRQHWQSDYRTVSSVLDPNASIYTLASFIVEDGIPGAQPL